MGFRIDSALSTFVLRPMITCMRTTSSNVVEVLLSGLRTDLTLLRVMRSSSIFLVIVKTDQFYQDFQVPWRSGQDAHQNQK